MIEPKNNMEEKSLFIRALETFGAAAQITMVFEEMAELQKELCKNQRGKENREAIAEEIADVQIMLEQMMLLFNCEHEVLVVRGEKVNRLEQRINNITGDKD